MADEVTDPRASKELLCSHGEENTDGQPSAKRTRTEQNLEGAVVEVSPKALLPTHPLDSSCHGPLAIALAPRDSQDGKSSAETLKVAGQDLKNGKRAQDNRNAEASNTSSIVMRSPVASFPQTCSNSTGSASRHGSSGEAPQSCPLSPGSLHVPPKPTTMFHLQKKYTGELEYMLREFRKLERQLLGANRASQIEESRGSRERREKLHSFILHLEDTIGQIELGCKLEAEGKSTVMVGVASTNGSAPQPSVVEPGTLTSERRYDGNGFTDDRPQGKEEEENVQKMEEHILANLLPVKVRLKKQLAAQQGATRNPAGMPTPRRGMLQPSAAVDRGKGTFAAAAEERLKQAEEARLAAQQQRDGISNPSQFGNPLSGGGSSLTQKLHGSTLGSKSRTHGDGVGTAAKNSPAEGGTRKVLYGGMVPGSTQHHSGVAAASGVHEMVIDDSQVADSKTEIAQDPPETALVPCGTVLVSSENPDTPSRKTPAKFSLEQDASLATSPSISEKHSVSDSVLCDEARKKLRKRRRKKKLLRIARRRERERQRDLILHQQAVQAAQLPSNPTSGRKKVIGNAQGKKKGPRPVEYICALCSEAYSSTCDYNPWWALAQHECPKCRKTQIPRIDITSPANAIEYHPALLAHAEDNGGGTGSSGAAIHTSQTQAPAPQNFPEMSAVAPVVYPIRCGSDADSESDLSDLSDGPLSDDSGDSDATPMEVESMSPAEQAERETFGHDYKGPLFSNDHAGRLLVLMSHAATCPCRHQLTKLREVCQATKYMMLHVRDCPGTTSTCDVCPFPWCRKTKHLLYHLVTCTTPGDCTICSPKGLSRSFQALVGLNGHRWKNYREPIFQAKFHSGVQVGSKRGRATGSQMFSDKGPHPNNWHPPDGLSSQNKPIASAPQGSAAAGSPKSDDNKAVTRKVGALPAVDLVSHRDLPAEVHTSYESMIINSSDPKPGEAAVFVQKANSFEKAEASKSPVAPSTAHLSEAPCDVRLQASSLLRTTSSKARLDETPIDVSHHILDQPPETTIQDPPPKVPVANDSMLRAGARDQKEEARPGTSVAFTSNSEKSVLVANGSHGVESKGTVVSLGSSGYENRLTHFETDVSDASISAQETVDPDLTLHTDAQFVGCEAEMPQRWSRSEHVVGALEVYQSITERTSLDVCSINGDPIRNQQASDSRSAIQSSTKAQKKLPFEQKSSSFQKESVNDEVGVKKIILDEKEATTVGRDKLEKVDRHIASIPGGNGGKSLPIGASVLEYDSKKDEETVDAVRVGC